MWGGWLVVFFYGEGEYCVFILWLMWFVYVDVSVYCCVVVVVVWFMCQFLVVDVEGCIWCGVFNVCQLWQCGNCCINDVVQLSLVNLMVVDGVVQ